MGDVLHLAVVSEASLLHALRLPNKRDDIYTSAGPILISINPYKTIVMDGEPWYSDNIMMNTATQKTLPLSHVPPHLLQVAHRAYNAMMDLIHSVPHLEEVNTDLMISEDYPGLKGRARNQSIIISGESGAGSKPEATKYYIMQYLACITKKRNNCPTDSVTSFPYVNNGKLSTWFGPLVTVLRLCLYSLSVPHFLLSATPLSTTMTWSILGLAMITTART